jgi:hypothetical protein
MFCMLHWSINCTFCLPKCINVNHLLIKWFLMGSNWNEYQLLILRLFYETNSRPWKNVWTIRLKFWVYVNLKLFLLIYMFVIYFLWRFYLFFMIKIFFDFVHPSYNFRAMFFSIEDINMINFSSNKLSFHYPNHILYTKASYS